MAGYILQAPPKGKIDKKIRGGKRAYINNKVYGKVGKMKELKN